MKRNLKLNFGTDSKEFKHYVGRKPTKEEFDKWVHYLENCVNAQLDWDIINKCTADNFSKPNIDAEIMSFKVNEIHEACQNAGHTCNWEYFDKELKTYSQEDKERLLKELENLEIDAED